MAKRALLRQYSLAAMDMGYNMVPQRQETPMSDPNTASPGPIPDPAPTGPTGNWRDQRRAERAAWRAQRHDRMGRGWGGVPIGGLVILAIGVIMLLGNFGLHLPPRWWAIFILIPAVGMLVGAIRFYRVDNTMNGRAMGLTIGGTVLLALALALFFGLNLGVFWTTGTSPVVMLLR
jgi:hypothetical protein